MKDKLLNGSKCIRNMLSYGVKRDHKGGEKTNGLEKLMLADLKEAEEVGSGGLPIERRLRVLGCEVMDIAYSERVKVVALGRGLSGSILIFNDASLLVEEMFGLF